MAREMQNHKWCVPNPRIGISQEIAESINQKKLGQLCKRNKIVLPWEKFVLLSRPGLAYERLSRIFRFYLPEIPILRDIIDSHLRFHVDFGFIRFFIDEPGVRNHNERYKDLTHSIILKIALCVNNENLALVLLPEVEHDQLRDGNLLDCACISGNRTLKLKVARKYYPSFFPGHWLDPADSRSRFLKYRDDFFEKNLACAESIRQNQSHEIIYTNLNNNSLQSAFESSEIAVVDSVLWAKRSLKYNKNRYCDYRTDCNAFSKIEFNSRTYVTVAKMLQRDPGFKQHVDSKIFSSNEWIFAAIDKFSGRLFDLMARYYVKHGGFFSFQVCLRTLQSANFTALKKITENYFAYKPEFRIVSGCLVLAAIEYGQSRSASYLLGMLSSINQSNQAVTAGFSSDNKSRLDFNLAQNFSEKDTCNDHDPAAELALCSEILAMIFDYLGPASLLECLRVNRAWNNIAFRKISRSNFFKSDRVIFYKISNTLLAKNFNNVAKPIYKWPYLVYFRTIFIRDYYQFNVRQTAKQFFPYQNILQEMSADKIGLKLVSSLNSFDNNNTSDLLLHLNENCYFNSSKPNCSIPKFLFITAVVANCLDAVEYLLQKIDPIPDKQLYLKYAVLAGNYLAVKLVVQYAKFTDIELKLAAENIKNYTWNQQIIEFVENGDPVRIFSDSYVSSNAAAACV